MLTTTGQHIILKISSDNWDIAKVNERLSSERNAGLYDMSHGIFVLSFEIKEHILKFWKSIAQEWWFISFKKM